MSLRSQISCMTIRARVAFGLVCAERACNHLGLSNDEVHRIFTSLWRYTSDEDLAWWGCKQTARDILESADATLAMRDSLFLYRVMGRLDEIGGGNLFGGFRNEYTLMPTLQLCRILTSRQVSLPPTRPFIRKGRRTILGIPNIFLGWDYAWGRTFDGLNLRELASGDSS